MLCGNKTLSTSLRISIEVVVAVDFMFYSLHNFLFLQVLVFCLFWIMLFYIGCFPWKSTNPRLLAHIYTWDIEKLTGSSVRGWSLLIGQSYHGRFQWSRPNGTVCPATSIPRANRRKRARSFPFGLKTFCKYPFFNILALSTHTCLHVPKPALVGWVPSLRWIKFSPGWWVSKSRDSSVVRWGEESLWGITLLIWGLLHTLASDGTDLWAFCASMAGICPFLTGSFFGGLQVFLSLSSQVS